MCRGERDHVLPQPGKIKLQLSGKLVSKADFQGRHDKRVDWKEPPEKLDYWVLIFVDYFPGFSMTCLPRKVTLV